MADYGFRYRCRSHTPSTRFCAVSSPADLWPARGPSEYTGIGVSAHVYCGVLMCVYAIESRIRVEAGYTWACGMLKVARWM